MSVKYVRSDQWSNLVERSDRPVLVEFMSHTCSICAAMAPYVDKLADKFEGKAFIYRVNAQEEQGLAMRFGVMGVPSFLMLCKGKPIASMAGSVYPALLDRMVQEAMEHGSECATKQTRVVYSISGYG